MNYQQKYKWWLTHDAIDEETKTELESLKDNESEIEDRFYKELTFGTAGLRGKIGAGTNRMNHYIIGKVTKGLADYILEQGIEYAKKGVVIAYDCRHFSYEFANRAASVLCANGIKVYLFESLRPTPELSFAVRYLKTASGIVITASHNPKEYNGYKVYWEDGSQILEERAVGIVEKISNVSDFTTIKTMEIKEAIHQGLLKMVGKEIDDVYMDKVKSLAIREDIDRSIKIVYTPLNGTGNIPVRRILLERGFENVMVVPEQENPDPNFTTVGYPNPEDVKAFEYAKNLGEKMDADVLVATDPDCDRLGVMVKNQDGKFISLNGNQTGAILIYYILKSLKDKKILSKNSYIVKSIVTGDLGKNIAESFDVVTYETLTGFKNICGKVNELEKKRQEHFLFGYEESIGYVAGTFVRDKDGVIASMLLCEACAYFKKQGKTLLDVLNDLYDRYGVYKEKLISIVLEGIEGQKRIERMMKGYRQEYPVQMGKGKLAKMIDYEKQMSFDFLKEKEETVDVPKSNVLKFRFDDHSWYALRPSGTEPKIKFYMYVKANTPKEADEKLKSMERIIKNKLESIQ